MLPPVGRVSDRGLMGSGLRIGLGESIRTRRCRDCRALEFDPRSPLEREEWEGDILARGLGV